jgi:hypothetical protein
MTYWSLNFAFIMLVVFGIGFSACNKFSLKTDFRVLRRNVNEPSETNIVFSDSTNF